MYSVPIADAGEDKIGCSGSTIYLDGSKTTAGSGNYKKEDLIFSWTQFFTLLISVIVGITNVIPYFGPFIGAIPSAFIVFIADPPMTIWFLLMILVIQQLDGNVIGPKILGNTTGMTSLAVLVSITIAGGFFGFAGMILGVPVAAVLCVLFRQRTDSILRKKNASTHAEDYYDYPPQPDFTKEPIFFRRGETMPESCMLPEEREDTEKK